MALRYTFNHDTQQDSDIKIFIYSIYLPVLPNVNCTLIKPIMRTWKVCNVLAKVNAMAVIHSAHS
jgi:hypothetical protein